MANFISYFGFAEKWELDPLYMCIDIYVYICIYIYVYIYVYTYIHNLFRHYLDREIMMKPMDLGVPYIFAYNSRSISRKCALS